MTDRWKDAAKKYADANPPYIEENLVSNSRLQTIKKQAFQAGAEHGYSEALEAAAKLMQGQHTEDCRRWECGNCTKASAIRALAAKSQLQETGPKLKEEK